jgi:outer membrane protein TolC
VATSQQKVYSEQNGVENGWLQLNYLIGAPPEFRGNLSEEPQGLALAALNQQADFSRRGEIAALKDAVVADEYSVHEAKGNYYPEFFARLAMDYTKNDEVKEQAIYSGTLGFKVNVFDGFATTARVRQAVQARSRDEQRLRDLETRVRLELASARNDLKVAQARIQVTQKAIAQAEENLRITRDRYQEKVGTATEVVDAQTLLTQTRTDYYQSVFDLQVAGARVKRAVGEL